MRERFGDIPFMFLSGTRTEAFDKVAGLEVGADDYLVKPFESDELLARVRALLRRSARSREAPAVTNESALTARELEILQLLAAGLPQAEIASRLFITQKTVGQAHRAAAEEAGRPQPSRSHRARLPGGVDRGLGRAERPVGVKSAVPNRGSLERERIVSDPLALAQLRYRRTTKASTSTVGRPSVPATQSFSVCGPEDGNVRLKSTFRPTTVSAYWSIVAAYAPST